MKWVATMSAVIAHLQSQAGMAGIPILMHGEFTELQVPSVAWLVFSDRKDENTGRVDVQFDIYARGIDQAIVIETAVRSLDRDTPQAVGGALMLATLDDARGDADPEPGVTHRSLDFTFEPTRRPA